MMRCAACGAELEPGKFAPQDRASASGAVERALICASCEDVAHRSSGERRRLPASGDAVAMHDAPPLSSESADDLDECEILLRRAIEMVRGAPHRTGPSGEATSDALDAPTEVVTPQPLDHAPPASASPVAERDLDECEVLLGRAIAMVRGPVRRTRPIRGLTDGGPVVATQRSGSVRVERLPTSRAVAIQHDTLGGYVAVDAKTGLPLLRHQNAGELGIMCDRIGWQVIGAERRRAGQ